MKKVLTKVLRKISLVHIKKIYIYLRQFKINHKLLDLEKKQTICTLLKTIMLNRHCFNHSRIFVESTDVINKTENILI